MKRGKGKEGEDEGEVKTMEERSWREIEGENEGGKETEKLRIKGNAGSDEKLNINGE